ncbi:MAG TPA: mobile mystery protein B [Verrucomicrobiae bacterium]|jgi:Fic-DOC domain mobile mystery protein B|nr:mobile mystery protein B [Verrucomicrobiae bacterium]
MSSDDDLFAADDAATPLTPQERHDLIPTYVALRSELNEVEALNVAAGERWALSRKRDVLDEVIVQRLHLRMFGDVWRWAGKYRSSERNIGVAPHIVPVAMRQTIEDAKYWVEHKSWPSDELAVRFSHKLVSVHPFPNGNGRWSRLAGDLLAMQLGEQRFTWGSGSIASISDTRRAYVDALKKADGGNIGPLLAFARS